MAVEDCVRAGERETVTEEVIELETSEDEVALGDDLDVFDFSAVPVELLLGVILPLSLAEFVTVLLADVVTVAELVADEMGERVTTLVPVKIDESVTVTVADLVAQAVDVVVAVPDKDAEVVEVLEIVDTSLVVLVSVPVAEIVDREEDCELLDEDTVADETGENVAVFIDVALAFGERVSFDVPVMTVETEEEPVADDVTVLMLDNDDDDVTVLTTIVPLPVSEAVGETDDENEAESVTRSDRLPKAVYEAEADIDGEVEVDPDDCEVPDTVGGVLIEGEGIVDTVTDTDFIKELD
jgi:hypothetical protein